MAHHGPYVRSRTWTAAGIGRTAGLPTGAACTRAAPSHLRWPGRAGPAGALGPTVVRQWRGKAPPGTSRGRAGQVAGSPKPLAVRIDVNSRRGVASAGNGSQADPVHSDAR